MAIIYRGRVGGNYQYWTENDPTPSGSTDIVVVNVPVLTASHVDRSVYARDGISGSLQTLTGSQAYLLAGPNITLATNSLGQVAITGSAGGSGDIYWQSDVAGNIFATGSAVISSSLNVGLNGAGRGLLRVGTLDISPITGSATTNNGSPTATLNGNVLSAANGVWDGLNEVALRHEFHVLGIGRDSALNVNQFAATYLVMSNINATTGIQTAIAVTEISRETTGSFATGSWDVNVNLDCNVTVTGGMDFGKPVYWYVQRVKEMAIRIDGTRT